MAETCAASGCACRRHRKIIVLFCLLIFALGAQVARGRDLSIFMPSALKAESRHYQHFFIFSKWLNRYYDIHKRFPTNIGEGAAEQGKNADEFMVDPWQTRYRFHIESQSFLVRGAGPDRQFDTGDDRCLWSQREIINPVDGTHPAEE